MKIEIDDFWNGIEQTLEGETALDSKVVAKHKTFNHSITWFDPKTTTVPQAITFTDCEKSLHPLDTIDLILLIKHECNEGFCTLEYANGMYRKSTDTISQFRICFIQRQYDYLPIRGELLAFAFVDDLPLMRIFNEDEEM